MDRKKPYIYKRVVAFIIDLLIVTILSGILTIMFTNTDKYNEENNKLIELTDKMVKNEINQEDFTREFNELNYSLTKEGLPVTVITIVVSIVYYSVMCYFCHGITLGKYIFKIKITSANDKELNIFNYLLRSLIVNSILSNIMTIVLINFLSKESYINVSSRISNVFTIAIVVSFIMMMYRDDGRGLHDLIGNTKVINIKNTENVDEPNEEIKEVQVIEEKVVEKGKVEKNERTNRTRNR